MRTALCWMVALFALGFSVVAADEGGKTHVFERAKLPKMVKANAADTIIVVEDVKPEDVETIKVKSDNVAVKVKTEAAMGKVRVVISGAKKGKAKVEWEYETANGRVGGHKGLEIEIE
jgi:hypothetical protein